MRSGATLLLDMSTSAYIALLDGDGAVLVSRIIPQRQRDVPPHVLIAQCLREKGMDWGDLARAVVGVGPGSFTGIRVAVATVQGICFARSLPIHAFSTLQAMRVCAPGNKVCALIGASGDSVYLANASGEWMIPRGEMAQALQGCDYIVHAGRIGSLPGGIPSGADEGPKGIARPVSLRFEEHIDFPAIARLALASGAVAEGRLRPNYLQASAAEVLRMQAHRPAHLGSGD